MALMFQRCSYSQLNARQKEAYNFQKVSGVLADYGYVTIRLSSDWGGADFIAQHRDGTFLKVQLKGRMSFGSKYLGKELHICFRDQEDWFVYPHDQLLKMVQDEEIITGTKSWEDEGTYHFPYLTPRLRELLKPWRLVDQSSGAEEAASFAEEAASLPAKVSAAKSSGAS